MKKRGQAWGFDSMMGAVIFITGALVFYFFALNYGSANNQKVDQLVHDTTSVADSLLSEGIPANWNATSVTKIGIITNNKVNNTKLATLYNMSRDNYNNTRRTINTRVNYFINFSEPRIVNSQPVQGIGIDPTNATDTFRVTHYIVYNDKPTTLYVILWN